MRRRLGPPRKEFIYVSDDGQVVAMRYDDWKVGVPGENRGKALACGASRLWNYAFYCCSICAVTRSSAHSITDRLLERTFVLVPLQCLAAKFLQTMKDYPPSQSPASFNLSKIEERLTEAGGA